MEKLNPKVRIRWAIKYIFYSLIAVIIVYFSSSILENALGLEKGIIFTYFISSLFILLFPYLLYIELLYRSFRYGLNDKELIVKKGIINISQVVVPFERIQNINLEIDWISNILGIAKVKIETAGSNVEDSEIEIPGVDNPKKFIKVLIDKVEKARERSSSRNIEKNKEKVLENTLKIENIEKSLDNIKDMLNSISHRLIAYESDFNQIHDKLERMENFNSNIDTKIRIVEENQKEISERVNNTINYFNEEIENIKKIIEKIKESKKSIINKKTKKNRK